MKERTDSERRQAILKEVVEYILEHGLADLSLRPLAAKVGTKARLLIYHFGSREALIAQAMVVIRNTVQQEFVRLVRQNGDQRPSEIIRVFWRWTTAHENYLRLFFEVHGLALEKPAVYGRYLEGAFAIWEELILVVLPRSISLARRRALAALAVSATIGLLLDHLSSAEKKRTTMALNIFAGSFDRLLTDVD